MKFALSMMLGLWALYSFSGCAMIDSLRDESATIDAEAGTDHDREGNTSDIERPVQRQRGLNGLSANNVPSYEPSVARGYGRRLSSLANDDAPAAISSAQQEFRRATREDFIDKQAHENSLWDGQGQGNYLFSNNRKREVGDLMTGEVEKDLKREIQYQLWMTLPPEQRKTKRAPASVAGAATDPAAKAAAAAEAGKSAEEKGKDAAAEAAKTNMADTKDDDVVRMEVVESLGNGLVRVVGQKRVIYRGVSRVVEVMALVNNKDVDDNNRVKSSNFLDMKTQVIQ
ncbi:MAG: flagellar basal body L-ring protein FlgH [Bacteriovoracia bacterium]